MEPGADRSTTGGSHAGGTGSQLRTPGRMIAAAGLGGAAAMALPAAASAATFTVDSDAGAAADGVCGVAVGDCTLADAIEASNDAATEDRIVFAAALSGDIELTAGLPPIGDSVAIDGPGAGTLAVDGGGARRILYIRTLGGAVSIDGLTLKNGIDFPGGGRGGGAIYARQNERLSITDSVLSGNASGLANTPGGAIHAVDSPLEISGSTLSMNQTAGDGGKGGAIYIDNAPLTLDDTTVSDNLTGADGAGGGAVYAQQANVDVTRSTLSGNSTAGEDADGGALGVYGGLATIAGSTIGDNSTGADDSSGGALFARLATLRVDGSTLSENSTAGSRAGGGAIGVDNSSLELRTSTLSGNSATGTSSGGAVHGLRSQMQIRRSTLSGNTTARTGAAVSDQNSDTTVVNSTFYDNAADGPYGRGGAIYGYLGADAVTIRSSTIADNSATSEGGGIALSGKQADLNNTIVSDNSAASGQDLHSRIGPGDQFFATFSLIGSTAGAVFVDGGGSRVGEDPKLGPLADNGGPTMTRAIAPDSPARNIGNSTALAIDQRGVARPQDGLDDVGAYELEVDALATTLDPVPEARSADATATVGFASPDADSERFECSLDGAAFAACNSPFTTAPLVDGEHTISVRALDRAGNSGAPAAVSFIVDSTGPATTVDSAPDPTTPDSTPTISFSSPDADAAGFQCSLDGSPFTPCTSPFTAPQLAEGVHTFAVRGLDDLGNVGAPQEIAFTIREPEPSPPGPAPDPEPSPPGPTPEPEPSPPGPIPDPDTEVGAPHVRAKKKQRQKGRTIKVEIKGGAEERVTGVAKGRVSATGRKGKPRAVVAARRFKLVKVTKSSGAGKRKIYRLKPKRRRFSRRIFRLLRRGRNLRANPSLKLTDAAGNSVLEKRVVRLKLKRGRR